jgi:hypothetical protein
MPQIRLLRPVPAAVLALLLTAASASAADPAPVLPGLWEVNLLTSFAPGPAAHGATPDLTPRRRSYRLCIGPARVHEPMHPPRNAVQTEMMYGRSTISGSYALPGPGGPPQPVEFAYHRLDATHFEGSHDLMQPELVTRTQYMARRVAADCGGLAPQATSETGEP